MALTSCALRPSPTQPQQDNLPKAGLDAALLEVATRSGVKNISAALLRPNGTAWHGQAGSGAVAWGSITKMPVAAAAFALTERSAWQLSDPIGRYVTGLPWGDVVTLSDLLAHTAGLPRDIEDAAHAVRSAEAERLALTGLAIARQGHFAYSNAGYRAIALAMESVTGRSWQQIVQQYVFMPAGTQALILSPRFAVPAQAAPGAAGALRGSASEVAQLLNALLAGQIISKNSLNFMLSPLRESEDAALRFGRGLIVYDLPDGGQWVGHSGGTRDGRAIVAWMPTKQAIIAIAMGGQQSAEAAAKILAAAL